MSCSRTQHRDSAALSLELNACMTCTRKWATRWYLRLHFCFFHTAYLEMFHYHETTKWFMQLHYRWILHQSKQCGYIENIQAFGMNMTLISSSEVKNVGIKPSWKTQTFHFTRWNTCHICNKQLNFLFILYNLGLDARKPVFGVSRSLISAFDIRLLRKYHISTCFKRNFNFLASLCS